MKEKVVFITGANGGLGTSVTKAFLQQGARVIGGSLRITAADFPQPNFEAMAIDFSKLDEIKHGVAKIVERYGRLDALVHLLGGFAGGPSVAETTDAMWEQMQNINLTSAFHVFRECIPHLRKVESRTANCDWQPGGRAAPRQSWSLCHLQGGAGYAGANRGAGKCRRGDDRKRGPAGDHGHACELQSHA